MSTADSLDAVRLRLILCQRCPAMSTADSLDAVRLRLYLLMLSGYEYS